MQFRTDGNPFNLRRLQARTKVHTPIIRDLVYADDCALLAHTLHDAQDLLDKFVAATRCFGLTISVKKTEVLVQHHSISSTVSNAAVLCDGDPLQSVDNFCYLGSTLSRSATIDNEVNARLAKAGSSFGMLTSRLWNVHGIRIETKVAVYRAVVLTVLLYGRETWTVYRRHIRELDQFHLRCLRKIAHMKWQDKIPNVDVLERCHISGIEAMLIKSHLRWSGHVARMPEGRIPKMVLYG